MISESNKILSDKQVKKLKDSKNVDLSNKILKDLEEKKKQNILK